MAPTAAAATGAITEYSQGLGPSSSPLDITVGPNGGHLWFTDTGQGSAPAIGEVNPATGDSREYRTGLNPGSAPWNIIAGPDGSLWFTDQGTTPAVGEVNPATGAIKEYPTGSSGNNPTDIVVGPGGNLWFTIQGIQSAIGELDPSTGKITEYRKGLNSGSLPQDIVVGPDGNLWFTDQSSTTPAIGELNPTTGKITEYSLRSGSSPQDIVVGPDGNLWFTDQSSTAPAIGELNPSTGAVKGYFALPSGSVPSSIIVGPDSRLWFTDEGNSAIGAVDPSTGKVQEYTGLIGGSGDLVVGSDGDVWFTEVSDATSAVAIGRVDPVTGAVTNYTAGLQAGSYPNIIVSGPNDNLWFTDDGANLIGEVDIAPTITAVIPDYGPISGGTQVTIQGTGLNVVSAVYFGADQAGFTLSTATSLQAVAPPEAQGTVYVTVYNPGGSSATGTFDQYTYLAPAAVTLQLVPATAAPGTAVTVTGAVYDSRGDVLPGMTVDVAVYGSPAVAAVTNAVGVYTTQITAPPTGGNYVVTATVAGTSPVVQNSALLTVVEQNATSGGGGSGGGTFSTGTATCNDSFPDVPANYWAHEAITTLACRGVVVGFPDGLFRPHSSVTRAQFVSMLVHILGLKLGTGNTAFADVPPAAWYAPLVAAAQQAGILHGLSPTQFGPNEPLTREQMAVMLANSMGSYAPVGGALHFTDTSSIAPWALAAVQKVVAAGLMVGFPDGSFRPTGLSTRAQAAAVLFQDLAYFERQ
jgi:streptogramin lyase